MPHDISQFKVVQDNEDHYVVKHPDGSDFQVAKSALTPEYHQKIQKLFSGGVAHYADGTGDAEPEDVEVPPITPAPQPTTQQPQPTQYVPQADQNATPGNLLEKSLPEYATSFGEAKQAAGQQAEAVAGESKEAAGALDKTVTGLQSLQEQSDLRQQQLQSDSDKFKAEIAKGNIDPNRLYNDMGVGQKITTAIGLILGGIGAGGTGGRNLVVDHINQLVAQDVDAQKANMANKQNLFRLNLEQSGDERQASLLTQRQLLDTTQTQLQAAAARASDPKAKAAAMQAYSAIDQTKAGIDNNLRLFQWQRQLQTTPFQKEALGLLPPEQQKRAIILPDGQTAVLATDEKSAGEARQAVNTTKPLLDTLEQIEKIRSSVIPIGKKAEQVRSLLPSAMLQLKQAQKLGKLSPESMKLLESQFSDPTSLVDAIRGPEKTKTLRNTLQNQLNIQLQSASPAFKNPNNIPGAVPKYGR